MILQWEADPSWLYEIGTIITIGIAILVIYIISKIKSLFPGGPIVKKWSLLQILLLALIGSFILDWILLWFPEAEVAFTPLYIVNYFNRGALRIAIGIFLILIVFLFYKTYKVILLEKK